MEDLFSDIGLEVERGGNRIVAAHNAVVDDVYVLPLTREQFRKKFDLGEQRFQGVESERIGGGAINFALTSSSLGHPGAEFVGFMDSCVLGMVQGMTKLPLHYDLTKPRRNTVIELIDDNLLLHDASASRVDSALLSARVRSLGLSSKDWLASCSFYLEVTLPLLDLSSRFFLDSGYGYPRREKGMMSSLMDAMSKRTFSDFIVAANQTELENLCDEFGIKGGTLEKASRLSFALSDRSGSRVSVLLHTVAFSTLMDPMEKELWAVPTIDISVKRRTNAGDTFAGAFLSAFDATGNPRLSAFYANSAAAKRLADDELPTRQNVAEFLKRLRMRPIDIDGGRVVGTDELRDIMHPRASSVCLRASPARAHPALQIAK
jgi:sugar/nucleoside kinase (ribokinase family)